MTSKTSKIQDIARAAGVSIATVSLALNNKKGVNAETRRKVLEIAQELQYTPSALAQGLSGKRTNNIAIFMSGPQYDYFNSSFYFDTLKHFAKGISNSGLQMMVRIVTLDEEAARLRTLVSRRGIDAIVFMGVRLPIQDILGITGDLPCLFMNRKDPGIHSVSIEYEKGVHILTRHLLELGHREIGFLGYIPDLQPAESRLSGYKKALEEFDVPYRPELVGYADYYQESGCMAMREFIRSGAPLPSAMIGGNDLIAYGALEALQEAGYRIPDDISLAGLDNLPYSHLLNVPLTTVMTRHDVLGEAAAGKLLDMIHGENMLERETTIDVQLIVRESTAAPRV